MADFEFALAFAHPLPPGQVNSIYSEHCFSFNAQVTLAGTVLTCDLGYSVVSVEAWQTCTLSYLFTVFTAEVRKGLELAYTVGIGVFFCVRSRCSPAQCEGQLELNLSFESEFVLA